MSDDLVSGGASFQQQGSLDWVSLSKSSWNFTMDVLARLSKAELNPATLVIGLIMNRQYSIKPHAQKEIHEALSRLRSFSTYGKIAWFGFGVKSILKDLAETEPGLSCLALCACMAVSYDSFFAATVLKELSRMNEVPSEYNPSINQWRILVQLCAGSLSASKFPAFLEGLLRLVRPHKNLTFHGPTTAHSIARVLAAFARMSTKKVSSITIIGGHDCIWLAAIAEWLFSFNVEIRVSSGDIVYRSFARRTSNIEVTVCFVTEEEEEDRRIVQLTQCFLVPQGGRLWKVSGQDTCFQGGRCEWNDVFVCTFGPSVNVLLQGKLQTSFALFLSHAAEWAEIYYQDGPILASIDEENRRWSQPFQNFHFGHPSSRGQGFLQFAAHRFPELGTVLGLARAVPIEQDQNATVAACFRDFASECPCRYCSNTNDSEFGRQACFALVAETIVSLIWLLSATEVDETLKPSPHGLRVLCTKHEDTALAPTTQKTSQRWRLDSQPYFHTGATDILIAALIVFSGSVPALSTDMEPPSAVSHDGLCAYFRALEHIDMQPHELNTVRLIPGHIVFEGSHYDAIHDLQNGTDLGEDFLLLDSYRLVVQEAPQPRRLLAAYQSLQEQHPTQWVTGISELVGAVAGSLRAPIQCTKDCGRVKHIYDQSVIFTSTRDANDCNTSGMVATMTSGWSIISQWSSRDDKIRLQVMQANLCRLYTNIINFHGFNHQLVFIQLCDGCNSAIRHEEQSSTPDANLEAVETSSWGSVLIYSAFHGKPSDVKMMVRTNTTNKQQRVSSTRNAALHVAVRARQEGLVQLLLQGRAKVDVALAEGQTALHLAAREGYDTIVKKLLVWASHLEGQDDQGRSPLMVAVCMNHGTTTSLLHNHGALVNTRDYAGRTPLMLACGLGHQRMVERLIQAGSHVDAVIDTDGITALQVAAEAGHLPIVDTLLVAGADINAAYGSALRTAARRGRLPIVQRLLRERDKIDINVRGDDIETALQSAAKAGHLEMVEMLLEANANVKIMGKDKQTALQSAVEAGHLFVVERLLRANASAKLMNQDGERAIQLSTEGQDLEVNQKLQPPTVDLDVTVLDTPLVTAASEGNLAAVEQLLQEELKDDNPVVQRRACGRTAPQAAFERAPLEIMNKLSKASANANVRADLTDALRAAAGAGHSAIVKRLRQQGADVNAPASGKATRTALLAAAEGGHLEVVNILLGASAQVNAPGCANHGRTALQAAAGAGHIAVVQRLLECGADVQAPSSSATGMTALEAAVEGGHLFIVKILIKTMKERRQGVSEDEQTVIEAAAEGGHLDIMETLLQSGYDDYGGLTAAARGGHLEVLNMLFRQRRFIELEDCEDPLFEAARGGHLSVVERILQVVERILLQGVKYAPEEYIELALYVAAQRGHLAIVEKLLLMNPDPDRVFGGEGTALDTAIKQGHEAVVDRLLQGKADIEARNGLPQGRQRGSESPCEGENGNATEA